MTRSVQNLFATKDGTKITLSWDKPEGQPESGAYHYSLRLYEGDKSLTFIQSPAKKYTPESYEIDPELSLFSGYQLDKCKVRVTAHDGSQTLDWAEILLAQAELTP